MRHFAAVLTAFIACAPLAVSAAPPAPGGSPENPNAAFVDAAYRVLLARPADPQASQIWEQLLASGGDRSTVVNALINGAEFRQDEINALYQHFLKRGADPAGLNTFGNMLVQGATVQQVAAVLVSTPEYFARNGNANDGFVKALYQGALGRPPSQNDLNTWVGQLSKGGLTRTQVAQAIIGSVEGRSAFQTWFNGAVLHGSGSPGGASLTQAALAEINGMLQSFGPAAPHVAKVRISTVLTPQQAYVTAAYQVVFGRPVDQLSLATFSQQMSQGMSRTQLVQYLESSQEFRKNEINFLYQKFLNRPADPPSLAGMQNLLGSGGAPASIAIVLVSSQEYFQRHGNTTNAGYVDNAYLDVLGQQPDKATLAKWTSALAAGTPRSQFATVIITDGTTRLQDALVHGILHGAGESPGSSLLQAALTEIDNSLK